MAEPGPLIKKQRTSLALVSDANNAAPADQDLFEFFAKKGGRAEALETENATLKKSVQGLQQALLTSRAELEREKEKCSSAVETSESIKALYKREQDETEEAYRLELGRTAHNEARVNQLLNEQVQLVERAEGAEGKLRDLKHQAAEEQRKAKSTSSKLQGELIQAKEREAELKAREAKFQQSSDTLPAEKQLMKVLEQRVQEAESRADAEVQKRLGVQEQLTAAEARLQTADSDLREAKRHGNVENKELIASLRKALKAGEEDVMKARKVLDRAKNVAVMREQLRSAVSQISRLQKDMDQAQAQQSRASDLKIQLQGWQNAAHEVGVESPGELGPKLRQLREECLETANLLAEARVEAKNQAELVQAADRRRAESEATLQGVQGALAESSAAAARWERKVQLLTKEREGLQKMLASYSAEEAANKGGAQKVERSEAEYEALNSQIKTLTEQVEQLEASVATASETVKQRGEELADVMMKVSKVEDERDQLQNDIAKLEDQIAILQGRLDKGEFNSSTTRVLHYVLNPAAESQKEAQQTRISDLEAELSILEARLEKAQPPSQATDEGAHDNVSREVAVREAELVVLKQKVVELSKREQRLKDVFQKQVSNFREAVYLLFGYRVDMAAEAQSAASKKSAATTFVLRPQHADSSRMQLMFEFKNGSMELLPTEFTAKKLTREVETFIDRFNSIPAFTANWTMDLFQKQTQH